MKEQLSKYALYLMVASLFAFSGLPALAQNVEFEEENFPGQEDAFDEADDQLDEGWKYYDRGYYAQALDHFLKAQEFNPNNAELNFFIGICQLNGQERSKALKYFKKAYELNPNIAEDIHYLLAYSYHINYEFDKAIREYQLFFQGELQEDEGSMMKVPKDLTKYINECETGKRMMQNPVDVKIENLGPEINSMYQDYAPCLTLDGKTLIFTSRREETTDGTFYEQDQLYAEDIYYSEKVEGKWQPAENMGRPINTDDDDAAASISPDGTELYIFNGRRNGGDILVSKMNNDSTWTRPESVESINTKEYEPSVSLSLDGNTIYFASNKEGEGSQGGLDLWKAEKQEDGSWGPSINLGPVVNTEYDEHGVFMHPDGKTMFFCSDGHATMGGWDIFMTTLQDDGSWSKPENLGYPINSPDDDVFIIITRDGKYGYYSSIKDGGYGLNDIYRITFPKPITQGVPYYVYLQVEVMDTASGELIDAEVRMSCDQLDKDIEFTGKEWADSIVHTKDLKFYVLAEAKEEGYYLKKDTFIVDYQNKDIEYKHTIEMGLIPLSYSTVIKGKIRNAVTGEEVVAKVRIKDVERGVEYLATSAGEYQTALPNDLAFELQITASAEGYQPYSLPLSIAKPEGKDQVIKQDIDLQPIAIASFRASLNGTVTDSADGFPLEGIVKISDASNGKLLGQTRAGKDGKYSFMLPADQGFDLKITASHDGYYTKTVDMTIPQPEGGNKAYTQDIALAKIPEIYASKLKGRVYDRATQEYLEAEIVFEDKKTGQKYGPLTTRAGDGRYEIDLPPNQRFELSISATSKGYMYYSDKISIPKPTADQVIEKDIPMDELKEPASFTFQNIYFNFDMATLRPESRTELDRVAKYLLDNPQILEVEIAGHTDTFGTMAYNQILSQNRAQAVVDYLVSKGVDKDRLTAKGYSYRQLASTGGRKEDHQKNRRVEFIIRKL